MQSAVGNRMPAARAGLCAHPFDSQKIASRAAEGAVPFGYGVVTGTDTEKQVMLPSADTQKFAGVAMFSGAAEAQTGVTLAGYRDKASVNVMTWGEIWVVTNGAIAVNDVLYLIPSGTHLGKFTATSVSMITAGLKVRLYDSSLGLALVAFTQSA